MLLLDIGQLGSSVIALFHQARGRGNVVVDTSLLTSVSHFSILKPDIHTYSFSPSSLLVLNPESRLLATRSLGGWAFRVCSCLCDACLARGTSFC